MSDVIDDTNQIITGKDQGSNLGTEVNQDGASASEELPFDKHPRWQEMSKKGKAVDEILETYGFESLDELQTTLADSTMLKEILGENADVDKVNKIIEDSKTKQAWEAYWASQAEQERLENLDPDDRARELEEENKKLKYQLRHDEVSRKQALDAERTIKSYETGISSSIKEDKDIPDFAKPFVTKYLGVDHPMNSVDDDHLADPKEIKKIASIASKDIKSLIDAAITAYKNGKLAAPDITPIQAVAVAGKKKIGNLKDAEKALIEIFTKK